MKMENLFATLVLIHFSSLLWDIYIGGIKNQNLSTWVYGSKTKKQLKSLPKYLTQQDYLLLPSQPQ